MFNRDQMLALTTDIVTAYVGNNLTPAGEMPALITGIYGALDGLGNPPAIQAESHVPAVSVRASVKHDRVTCMECGLQAKMLKRHLMTEHGLKPDQYRSRWGLPANHPLVAPEYAARRADLAKAIGLGRKPGQGK